MGNLWDFGPLPPPPAPPPPPPPLPPPPPPPVPCTTSTTSTTGSWKSRLKWGKKLRQEQLSKADSKGPLCGRTVRVVGWDVGPTLVNLTVRVTGHSQAEKKVQIELPGSKGWMTLAESQVSPMTGTERPPLADRLDLRTLTAEEKSEALAVAGNQVEFLQPASCLEAPEMATAWQEILLRGQRAKDALQPAEIVWLDPQTLRTVQLEFQAGRKEGESWEDLIGQTHKTGLWLSLRRACESVDQSCTVLLPVHSPVAGHWTLLVLTRAGTAEGSKPEAFQVQYFDSLPKPSQTALDEAAAYLTLLQHLLQPAELQWAEPLAASPSRKQADGWSCGYWVLLWCEQQYRLVRGEGARLLKPDWTEKRQSLNSWLGCLRKFQAAREKRGAVATEPVGPPPLPPPVGPPPELPGPGSLLQDECNWGCPKCRHSQRGCRVCNPYKAAKAAQGQTQGPSLQQ